LQALVTLNDSSFVVAAKHFALRMHQASHDPRQQIREGYKMLLVRDITPQKLDILIRLYDRAFSAYSNNVKATGHSPTAEPARPAIAALTVVANAMLNLDEVLTKE
jgi:hypothetical protein